jgi:signal transduction histidine kinase
MSLAAGSGVALVAAAAVVGALRRRAKAKRRYAFAECVHELRGALTALQLGASAVRGRSGDRENARLDALRTQIERAEAAIGDLDALVLSRRATSRNEPHELVDVGQIVRQRAAAWDRIGFALGGGVELCWSLGPAIVRADPRRLCQALDNLIANGLEHGGGFVTVAGALEGGVVRVTVSDRGSGIARSLEDVERAPWHAPHGHGLAIARRAIELHRGRLRATPRRGGTDFEIELPVAAPVDRLRVADAPPELPRRVPARARGAS